MKRQYLILVVGLLLAASYQNCSKTNFSMDSAAVAKTGTGPAAPNTDEDGGAHEGDDDMGVYGGHFDLDTSTKVYAPSKGTTNYHVHEYDNKYDVARANFFDLKATGLHQINEDVSLQTGIIITVANAQLSPGARLEINGAVYKATDWQIATGTRPVFSLNGSVGTKLNSLAVEFDKDVLYKNGLIPTATKCVRENTPGKLGEYRNGALTVQAHDATKFKLDPVTGVATSDGGLLWEATLFWHRDSHCY